MSLRTLPYQRLMLASLIAMGVTACGSSNDTDGSNVSTALSSSSMSSTSSSINSSSSMISSSSAADSSSSVAGSAIPNLLTSDGSFDSGQMNFSYGSASGSATWDGEFSAVIPNVSVNPWDEQFLHEVKLTGGLTYTVCFKAKGSAERDITVNIDTGGDGAVTLGAYASNIGGEMVIGLTTTYQSFVKTVVAEETDASARLAFNMGQSNVGVSLDDVGVFEGTECGSFDAAPVEGSPPIALAVTGLIGDVSNGETLYTAQCASCHIADGSGTATNPALTSDKVVFWKDGDDQPYSMEMYIVNFMPRGDATMCGEQCAADITAYIKAGLTVPAVATCGADSGVVCDDFEDTDINARWSVIGSAVLTAEEKYSGTQSLKVTGSGGGLNFNGVNLDLTQFASLSKNHYGRLMIKTPVVMENSGDFTFVEAEGPANLSATSRLGETNKSIYRARIDGSTESFMANYDTSPYGSPLTDCWSHGSRVAVPKDTWVCFEWRFDATSNTLSYWLNGTELDMGLKDKVGAQCAGHALDDIWLGPAKFTNLHVGIDQYHATSLPRTLYVDDVVVDTQRINCPAN